jgi:hypothetical protein
MLNKHDLKYKKAIALQAEWNKLVKLRRDVESIPLKTPIQHGFVKTLEFHDDVKKQHDFQLVKEIVEFLGIRNVYHPDKSFTNKIRRNRVTTEVILHPCIRTQTCPSHLYWYSSERARELNERLDKYRKYLKMCGTCFVCFCAEKQLQSRFVEHNFKPHYTFKYPSMMKEVVKPHFLTHYKPILPDVESRLAEINRKFENNRLWDLLKSYRSAHEKIANGQWLHFKYDCGHIYHANGDYDF